MAFIGAIIGGVASVAGGAMSAGAATSAANTQANALNNATAEQAQQAAIARQTLDPYVQSGNEAQGALDTFLGIQDPTGVGGSDYRLPVSVGNSQAWETLTDPIYASMGADNLQQQGGNDMGNPNDIAANAAAQQAWVAQQPAQSSAPGYGAGLQPFTSADLNANMAPNYAFSLAQGQGANENVANASGGLLGGNALQGLNTFTQNYAQGAYQQAYQNYNTNLSNIYSRLSGVANQGEAAAAGTAANALTAGAQQAGTIAASGAATAGGTIGAANALSGGLSNAGAYGTLGTMLNNNSTTATNAGFNQGISGYQDAATSGPINPLSYGDNYG